MNWYQGLKTFVRRQVPLGPGTFYKVGGSAEFFAEPETEEALAELLARAGAQGMPVRIMGHGSNLLVADGGVRGLTIRLPREKFATLNRDGEQRLMVGAGHSLPGLVNWSAGRGLHGLECLVGVPGTVGAALRMNAGGKYGEIGPRVRTVWGVRFDGVPFCYRPSDCGFTYRDSRLKDGIVTRCEMALDTGDAGESRRMIQSIITEKKASQPLAARSAGCVFKNPRREGVPPAGKIIDDLGLKGFGVGGASVSTTHANFLVCDGQATATDVAALIRFLRRRVREAHGIDLELEIATWGLRPEELGDVA